MMKMRKKTNPGGRFESVLIRGGVTMSKGVKYRDLKALLVAHGLKEERTDEALVFRVKKLPNIILPHYRDAQIVDPVHVVPVRRMLSLAGVLEEDQFEKFLERKRKIQAQRKRARRKNAVPRKRNGSGGRSEVTREASTLAAAPER